VTRLRRADRQGVRAAHAALGWRQLTITVASRAHVALVPAPAGVPSVLEWGDPEAMTERSRPYAGRIASVTMTRRMIKLRFPASPRFVGALFREYYGPTVRAFASLDVERRK